MISRQSVQGLKDLSYKYIPDKILRQYIFRNELFIQKLLFIMSPCVNTNNVQTNYVPIYAKYLRLGFNLVIIFWRVFN